MQQPYQLEHGERFGKVKALSPTKTDGRKWWVGCDCGSRFKARRSHLLDGRVTACLKCRPPVT